MYRTVITEMNLDFELLRRQKETLINMTKTTSSQDTKMIDGVISVIDSIQDQAYNVSGISSAEIFGKNKDRFEILWKKLGDIPVNDKQEIEEDFEEFKAGTDKYEVWEWLEAHFNMSIGEYLNNVDYVFPDDEE